MIRATTSGTIAKLASELTKKARTLATAHAETRLRAHRRDASRWRNARLLWPLFTKDR